jgi:flagellar L-ring protein precursor FlgH
MKHIASTIMLILLLSARASADSLFSQPEDGRPGRSGALGRPLISVDVGDIVKVKVREKTDANIDLGVELADDSKVSAKSSFTDKLLKKAMGPLFDIIGVGDLAFDNQNDFNGEGKTDRKVKVDGVLSVRVMDKDDNGLLTIAGVKHVTVNSEQQYMLIRGTVDPRDLDMDRMVESDLVADLEIEYVGEGQLSRQGKPGIVTRFFDLLF